MELMAAIKAVEYSTYNKTIIFSDSQYVVKGITQWIKGWKNKGWKTSQKKYVLNKNLWIKLDNLCTNKNIEWRWVKGHSGNKMNEIVDILAKNQWKNI